MAITIETPKGTDALSEFVSFHDTVYAHHAARWTAFLPLELPILTGESPFEDLPSVLPGLAGGETPALCHRITYGDCG